MTQRRSATVAGYDVTTQPSQVRRWSGYGGQGNGAGHTQRVGDELHGQGVIYGLDRRAAKQRAGQLLDALELQELAPKISRDPALREQRQQQAQHYYDDEEDEDDDPGPFRRTA